MNMNLIKRIREIGRTGICSDEDLHAFLPNFPTLHGSEFIFKIGWANAKKYVNEEVEYFIKGLHLIENKYKSTLNFNTGFGSPSPSYKVIKALELTNPVLANKLTDWILENGGNYYLGVKS